MRELLSSIAVRAVVIGKKVIVLYCIVLYCTTEYSLTDLIAWIESGRETNVGCTDGRFSVFRRLRSDIYIYVIIEIATTLTKR